MSALNNLAAVLYLMSSRYLLQRRDVADRPYDDDNKERTRTIGRPAKRGDDDDPTAGSNTVQIVTVHDGAARCI